MAWLRLPFLIFLFLPIGCGTQKLPVDIWIDSSFNEDQLVGVFAGMDLWEEALQERVGSEVFNFRGFFDDDEFEVDDIADGYSVIYKISEPTPTALELEALVSRNYWARGTEKRIRLLGYGLKDEVLIYWFRFANRYGIECLENGSPCAPEDEADNEVLNELYRIELTKFMQYKLQELVAHELGHFLGLGHHNADEEAIMNQEYHTNYPEEQAILEIDIENICELYGC